MRLVTTYETRAENNHHLLRATEMRTLRSITGRLLCGIRNEDIRNMHEIQDGESGDEHGETCKQDGG
jgi:hypothetical protein